MSEKKKIDPRYIPSLAERRIREAMQQGEFDNLLGSGAPIPDLEDGYAPAWWTKKWVRREGLSREGLAAFLETRRDRRH